MNLTGKKSARKNSTIIFLIIALLILLAVLVFMQLEPSTAYACVGNPECGQDHGGGGGDTGLSPGAIAAIITVVVAAIAGIVVGVVVYYFKVRKKHYRYNSKGKAVARKNPHQRQAGKVGQNDPCPCGSGRKYKMCCRR